ncbi:hypothetical protein ABW21_db0201604 [Orbilia brochopaga]|nr:hypothetical protein ABW21_db0201604 [Drechslerella brochopaga]
MRSQSLLIAALAITATALPIAKLPSKAVTTRRGLADGLLGEGGNTFSGAGIPFGVDRSPITGDALNGATDGAGVIGAPGIVSDDGSLGDVLDDLGNDGNDGLIGVLLQSLLGGNIRDGTFLDPSRQNVRSGTSVPARPQAGFEFTNIEVFSPPAGIIQKLLQALLGGKRSVFITRVPDGAGIQSINGRLFHANPTNIRGLCFTTDITRTNTWVETACTINISGYVQGVLVGALEPQESDLAKMVEKARQGAPAKFSMEAVPVAIPGATPVTDLVVDEVRMTITPIDPTDTILSVILDLGVNLTF